MASTDSIADEQQEADHGNEDTMQQTTTASISAMATAAETQGKQKRSQQKRAAGKCSDPLIAPNTTSSLNGGTIQPTAAVVRQFHPESRSRRDGGLELVTGVTIKLTLQASTANRSQCKKQILSPLE